MGKWTQGPWRWEFNPKTKTAQLCGGKPQFDSTVMDFVRVGMSGAGPRVIEQTDLGLLAGVAKFAQPSAGREHHSSWFQVLRHPDLDLIAAAPELAEALRMVVAADTAEDWSRAVDYARAALAKAGDGPQEGEPENETMAATIRRQANRIAALEAEKAERDWQPIDGTDELETLRGKSSTGN